LPSIDIIACFFIVVAMLACLVNRDVACRVLIPGFHTRCGRAVEARDAGLDLVASVADSENSSEVMLKKSGCEFELRCARCAAKLESAGIFFAACLMSCSVFLEAGSRRIAR